MIAASGPTPSPTRDALRRRLLEARARFATGHTVSEAEAALSRELLSVVAELEPRCLGLYWPHRAEFNAPAALVDHEGLRYRSFALPFARRVPAEMHYRLWNGERPSAVDECGIATSDGAVVVPDVVLVPCVGYTVSGHRLGYGGGYFDRWLAAHLEVCAVGVAWSAARIDDADLVPQPHDIRLALIVTERGPV